MTDDVRMWNELRAGDQKALKYIYEQHFKNLINYGYRITSDQDLVMDCIHDLFTDLWRLRAGLGETDSIRNYLIGSLRRRILKSLKSSARNTAELTDAHDRSDENMNFELALIREESESQDKLKLEKALAQLSKRQREAIYLKYSEGLDYEQICELMDLQYQSVRNLISTGLQRLRENIVWVVIFFLKF
jgi:RNA polymerase sigma factor (sigma-70 family)